MNDIQLTTDGDLYINDKFDIQATDSIAQAIRIRLRWFFAEWRFAPKRGVKYFEYVFVKRPNGQVITPMIKSIITGVDGVASVDSLSLEINKSTRRAVIKFAVTTTTRQKMNSEVDIEALIAGA